jgi:predicted acylesterase/phospholipase RssA
MTKTVDLVIVIDTSGSMKDEATDLSQAALKAIEGAASSCPCDLRVEWFGIEGRWKNTKFERRIRDYLLTECNINESDLRARKRGSLPGAGAQEDGARAVEDISKYFDWREGTHKAIFYLGDEALEGGGDRTTEKDVEAANQAIVAAKTNEVIVHTYFGTSNSKYRHTLLSEYARFATETQGQAFTAQDSLLGFQEVLTTVICSSQIEVSSTTEEDTTEIDTTEENNTEENNTDNASEESSPEMVESSVLGFDGKDDYIEIPYQPHLSPNQFTLSCWAKVTGKPKQWRSPITCRTEGPLGGYILYAGTDNNWQFWTGNGEKWVTLTGSNVVLRAWTHLAATYDGSKMTLYINGEQVGTPVESKIHLNQRFPLRIGAGRTEKSPGFFFMGQIAEVRLWNQVRSSAEIKQFINRRLTGNEAGLVGYWPLNEGSGTTVKDLTGNCSDCNISGATWKEVKIPLQESPAVEAPIANTASGNFVLSFDGLDDYVEIPEPFKNNTAFTISLWVNPSILNDEQYHGFIGKEGDEYRKPGLWVCPGDSGLHYDSYDPSGQRYWDLLPNFFEAKDQWVHIAWVKQGTEYTFYRNGERFATKPAPEQFYTSDTSYWLGRVDNFFAGYIAEVRIWSQARTEAEIQSDFSHRLVGNEAGLVGYWLVNEGSGSTIQDNTANGNNGNISGAVWEQVEIPIEPSPEEAVAETSPPSEETTVSEPVESPEEAVAETTPPSTEEESSNPPLVNNAFSLPLSPVSPGETTPPSTEEESSNPPLVNNAFSLPLSPVSPGETSQPSEQTSVPATTEESSNPPLVNNAFSLPLSPVSPGETTPPSETEESSNLPLVNNAFMLPLSPVIPTETSSPSDTEESSEKPLVKELYTIPLSPGSKVQTSPSNTGTKELYTIPLSPESVAETSPPSSQTKVPSTPSTINENSTQQRPHSKILSIDGGGIRGIIPAMILAEIEKRTQQPIHRLFDLIAGTSTGGILALGLTKPSGKQNMAGQPTAQYSAEELVEMYVEYGGLMFYESLCGKVIGPIEDVFAQPKFSSEAKEEVITKYFGDTYLTECLKEVLIVSYDLEKRIPVFFTSNSAKQQTEPAQYSKLCQGVTLKDAAMATSATPTYFKPHPIQAACNSSGCYSYTLVDGGIVVNNPARLAMIEAGVAEGKKQNDTLLLSLGAGCLTSVNQYKELKNWGLLQWTIPLLNTVFDGSSKLVAGELERLFEPARSGYAGSYYRWQTCLSEELEALDNTLLKNIKGLQDSANQLIKQKTREIDQLCEVLASSVSR